jgi:hypothetical protein
VPGLFSNSQQVKGPMPMHMQADAYAAIFAPEHGALQQLSVTTMKV